MDAADDTTPPPISTLRRRNSVGPPSTITVPIKHHYPLSTFSPFSISSTTTAAAAATSSSSDDFELISIKPTCYTSLRDILPSPAAVVHSPKTPSTVHPGYEIPIRNRLVKQAAWAYLQPMSTSPESHGSTLLRRLWTRFSFTFLRLFDCLLHSTL